MFMKQSKFLWCLDGIESDMTTCRTGWLVMVAESSTSSFDLIYDKISSHTVCTHSLVVTKPILPLNSLSFSNHFAYHIVFLCYHMISCFLYYSATKPMTSSSPLLVSAKANDLSHDITFHCLSAVYSPWCHLWCHPLLLVILWPHTPLFVMNLWYHCISHHVQLVIGLRAYIYVPWGKGLQIPNLSLPPENLVQLLYSLLATYSLLTLCQLSPHNSSYPLQPATSRLFQEWVVSCPSPYHYPILHPLVWTMLCRSQTAWSCTCLQIIQVTCLVTMTHPQHWVQESLFSREIGEDLPPTTLPDLR